MGVDPTVRRHEIGKPTQVIKDGRVGAFNQEKALVGAFSVIVQFHRLIDLRH